MQVENNNTTNNDGNIDFSINIKIKKYINNDIEMIDRSSNLKRNQVRKNVVGLYQRSNVRRFIGSIEIFRHYLLNISNSCFLNINSIKLHLLNITGKYIPIIDIRTSITIIPK